MRRLTLYTVAILALGGSLAAVADALVETDQERLEAFVEGLVETAPGKRADHLHRFIDASDTKTATRLRTKLAPFLEGQHELVQEVVSVEGDRALVVIRTRDARGLHDAQLDMQRHDARWLIDRASVN